MICEHCGAENRAQARFCRSCRRLIALQQPYAPQQAAGPLRGDGSQSGQGRPPSAPITPPAGGQYLPAYPRPLQVAQNVAIQERCAAPAPRRAAWSPLDPVPYSVDPATGLAFDPYYGQETMPALLRSPVPAAFFQRLGALLVDYCILSMIWFCTLVFATIVDSAALGLVATIFGPALYFISFWATGGRTPGYRAAGLQLVHTNGSPVGLGASIVRYIGSMLSWPFFFLGYLWMLWDPQSQTWHDKMADTTVIQS